LGVAKDRSCPKNQAEMNRGDFPAAIMCHKSSVLPVRACFFLAVFYSWSGEFGMMGPSNKREPAVSVCSAPPCLLSRLLGCAFLSCFLPCFLLTSKYRWRTPSVPQA